ncbi:hypothetical protein D0Z03_002170 [Geotrichum reessii]|nr:hypothetical protein D0Z03_002170 [Galactomyces reessii]
MEQNLKARQDVVYTTVYVGPDTPAPSPKNDNPEVDVVTEVVTAGANHPAPTSVSEPVITPAVNKISNENSGETTTSDSGATSSVKANGFPIPETLTYSPYNDDGTCKNFDQVYSDLSKIASFGINNIRVYGTDCGSISTIQPSALKLGLKINQGFWIGSSNVDSIDQSVNDLIQWVQKENGGDWNLFTTLTVGNEAIYSGFVDGNTLLGKIKSVKSILRSAGWNGPVTTAEPPQSYIDFPNLCTDTDGIDYVGLNAHPYFDANTSPDQAGNFVLAQIGIAQNTCNNRNIRITETGYPSAGNTNGKAIPTKENQATAIKSIMGALNNKAVLFTLYDDKWKNPGPYNVEQHFGLVDLL